MVLGELRCLFDLLGSLVVASCSRGASDSCIGAWGFQCLAEMDRVAFLGFGLLALEFRTVVWLLVLGWLWKGVASIDILGKIYLREALLSAMDTLQHISLSMIASFPPDSLLIFGAL